MAAPTDEILKTVTLVQACPLSPCKHIIVNPN